MGNHLLRLSQEEEDPTNLRIIPQQQQTDPLDRQHVQNLVLSRVQTLEELLPLASLQRWPTFWNTNLYSRRPIKISCLPRPQNHHRMNLSHHKNLPKTAQPLPIPSRHLQPQTQALRSRHIRATESIPCPECLLIWLYQVYQDPLRPSSQEGRPNQANQANLLESPQENRAIKKTTNTIGSHWTTTTYWD